MWNGRAHIVDKNPLSHEFGSERASEETKECSGACEWNKQGGARKWVSGTSEQANGRANGRANWRANGRANDAVFSASILYHNQSTHRSRFRFLLVAEVQTVHILRQIGGGKPTSSRCQRRFLLVRFLLGFLPSEKDKNTMVQKRKNTDKIAIKSFTAPRAREWASEMQTNQKTNGRVAQYLSLGSWLFWTIVKKGLRVRWGIEMQKILNST